MPPSKRVLQTHVQLTLLGAGSYVGVVFGVRLRRAQPHPRFVQFHSEIEITYARAAPSLAASGDASAVSKHASLSASVYCKEKCRWRWHVRDSSCFDSVIVLALQTVS